MFNTKYVIFNRYYGMLIMEHILRTFKYFLEYLLEKRMILCKEIAFSRRAIIGVMYTSERKYAGAGSRRTKSIW